jgi:hypothetical protein
VKLLLFLLPLAFIAMGACFIANWLSANFHTFHSRLHLRIVRKIVKWDYLRGTSWEIFSTPYMLERSLEERKRGDVGYLIFGAIFIIIAITFVYFIVLNEFIRA